MAEEGPASELPGALAGARRLGRRRPRLSPPAVRPGHSSASAGSAFGPSGLGAVSPGRRVAPREEAARRAPAGLPGAGGPRGALGAAPLPPLWPGRWGRLGGGARAGRGCEVPVRARESGGRRGEARRLPGGAAWAQACEAPRGHPLINDGVPFSSAAGGLGASQGRSCPS